MRALTRQIGDGTLTTRCVRELGEVVLGDHSGANQRLFVLCPTWDLLDGVAHYCFSAAIGERGIITGSENLHEASWVFSSAADWLREGCEVTVAAVDVPAEQLCAFVLVAVGWSAPAAVEMVSRLSPDFIWTPDVEIPVSALAENLRSREARA